MEKFNHSSHFFSRQCFYGGSGDIRCRKVFVSRTVPHTVWLIGIFFCLTPVFLWSEDYSWIGISNESFDNYNWLETAYVRLWIPRYCEYWEDRGVDDFEPEYLLQVEFIHNLDGLYWGASVPRMVIDDLIVGSYQLIDDEETLAYEMEVLTGDHITRITLHAQEGSDFFKMTKDWLKMISSVKFQENAPVSAHEHRYREFPYHKDKDRKDGY